ncbi:MAG: sugar phosphate isomerase/epimerase, partial [Candidatus Hydrogenedentes bacterium]|nr:sugar phosphate isomerase/epimerase [Candidatus Hydrogenedentota bacterium]
AAAAMMMRTPALAQEGAVRPPVCVFSKHLQHLDYEQLASTCKALGLDGVDLTVREGGHVLPGNVATDLPRAVDTIRSQGLDVPMVSTRLVSGTNPEARPILDAASKLGIRYFRIGGQQYTKDASPAGQLDGFVAEVQSLIALAEEFGMIAGYHNHSGFDYVGAPLWDLHRMIEAVDSEHFGSNFDVGHATVEGGLGAWEINARLLAPYVKMMSVKDFVWDNGKMRWGPLGEGAVNLVEFFRIFRGAGFAGPVSLHFEYKTASEDALLEAIGKANGTVRRVMQEAGYPA